MSLAGLLTEPVTILTAGAGTPDAHGNTEPDWAGATMVDTLGRLDQQSTTEVTIGRDTVITDGLLFLFPDAPIDSTNRVTVSDLTFEVVGEPALLTTPRGPHHYEVNVRAVES